MKKIFLLITVVAASLALNSCSKSSSSDSGSVTLKIDDVSTSYQAIAQQMGSTIWVHGYVGEVGNPTSTVDFYLPANTTGTDKLTVLYYLESSSDSEVQATALSSNVTTNNGSSVAGTFSATLEGGAVISEGSFSSNVSLAE